MRYKLGIMDMYSVAVNKTVMENASFFQVFLKEDADYNKLNNSIKNALNYHPLFKTRLIFDKEYLLETNNKEVIIYNVKVEDRPKEFGKNTNDYLFQVCYFKNYITFEWCHAVSDGRGALAFLSTILDFYFDIEQKEIPNEFPTECFYEKFYDKNSKSLLVGKQPKGFKSKDIKIINRGYKCLSHVLKVDTKEVLSVAKKIDSTPVAVIAPLFCKALRKHLNNKAKNKNVSCGFVIDGRVPLKTPCMHNSVYNKVITYCDKMDHLDLSMIATIYRSYLDIALMKENLIYESTKMINDYKFIFNLRPKFIRQLLMKVVAKFSKHSMNNIACTYIGRVPFNDKVKENLLDFRFRSWPDIGDCVLAISDLNGTLIIDISENYKDEGIIDSFINVCNEYGIHIKEEEKIIFEQANVRVDRL